MKRFLKNFPFFSYSFIGIASDWALYFFGSQYDDPISLLFSVIFFPLIILSEKIDDAIFYDQLTHSAFSRTIVVIVLVVIFLILDLLILAIRRKLFPLFKKKFLPLVKEKLLKKSLR